MVKTEIESVVKKYIHVLNDKGLNNEPVAVGSRRFRDGTGSPLIEIVKKEGLKIM